MKQFKRTRGRLPGSVGGKKEVRLCGWLHNTDTASNIYYHFHERVRKLVPLGESLQCMSPAHERASISPRPGEFFLTLFSLNSGSFAATTTIYLLTIRSSHRRAKTGAGRRQ